VKWYKSYKLLGAAICLLAACLASPVIGGWQDGGTPICTAAHYQQYPLVTSDGSGGAIMVWQDNRTTLDWDIYAQRVDKYGNAQWATNGIPICTAVGDEINLAITSDGAGGAIITWQDHRSGINWDIYAQRVTAAGYTWGPSLPVAISVGGSGQHMSPQIISDGSGGAIITWVDSRSGQNDIFAQRINGAGATLWASGGLPICDDPYIQQSAAMVSDGAGGAIIAWTDFRQGVEFYIYAQHVNGAGIVQWTTNGVWAYTTRGIFPAVPTMASDGAGGAIITFVDMHNAQYYISEIGAQRVTASGSLPWGTEGVVLCNNNSVQLLRGPQIVPDGSGGAIIAWYGPVDSADWDVYAQRVDANGNAKWQSNGRDICTAVSNQGSTRLASDGAGGAIIAWEDHRNAAPGAGTGIYAQHLFSYGAVEWANNGVPVCADTHDNGACNFGLTSDGAGGSIVIWDDFRSGTDFDIYAQHLWSGGCAHAPWQEDGEVISKANYGQRYPQVAADGRGGAIIVWQDNRTTLDWDVYAQRVDASGAAQWASDGELICGAVHDQQNLQVVSDGSGGAILAWEDYRSGTDWDIYAQRVDVGGHAMWSGGGVAICTAALGERFPHLVSEGSGGAIITWQDYRTGEGWDLYAQRVNASGVVQWPADGVPVCATIGDQQNMRVAVDGSGGAIITWEDWRWGARGSKCDIYAQRVDNAGNRVWGGSGITVCAADNDQQYPQIVSDGNDGAIITWHDKRGGFSADVYAQRVAGNGNMVWASGGVPICTAGDEQDYVAIASDSVGGAYIAWEDYRNGSDWNIYAQRVTAAGSTWSEPDGQPICTMAYGQRFPQITVDLCGAAIITWQDNRTTADWDIYAQRVNADGMEFPNQTVSVVTAMHDQAYQQLVPDGAAGAIFVWEDYRSGSNYDIYAQRFCSYMRTVAVPDPTVVPVETMLEPNAPNPFNPITHIKLSVRVPGEVSLRIYDIAGRLVRTLVDEQRAAGTYDEVWDGRQADGSVAPSGVYIYRLEAGGFVASHKMALLK
jgi:hypothetical protein